MLYASWNPTLTYGKEITGDLMNEKTDTSAVKPKRTKNAFPRVALKSVLELVDAINTLGHAEPEYR